MHIARKGITSSSEILDLYAGPFTVDYFECISSLTPQ